MHYLPVILRRWLARRRGPAVEPSRLVVGSTGSGKSEGELVELVRLADREDHAVVLLDGHGPLALHTAGRWIARGHMDRLVYEPLHATDRVLCWDMLPRSTAERAEDRRIADTETLDELVQCFLAPRNIVSLADKPWTKEWLEAAIALCLSQPTAEPLAALLHPFQIGTDGYEQLLRGSDQPALVQKFRDLERLRRKNEVQYEILTGASRRMLETVCASEVVRLRSRPGSFDWLDALRTRRLIAFDGGGIRSREIKRTLFLLTTMQVIQAVRRHFAKHQEPLKVALVLEEAGALGLVSPFVVFAEQELRKAGLALHVITQSSLDFGTGPLFESLLSHTPWQAWYQCLAPADQEIGAAALANATFDAHAVHFTRTRMVHDGVETVESSSHGESLDPHSGEALRWDRRHGTAFVPRYRHQAEHVYKSPQLQVQEYKTKLATLRIGERLVRDRWGVRRERVRMLRPAVRAERFLADTRAAIERVRERPIYVPVTPAPPPDVPPSPSAADVLRARAGGTL